MGDLKKQSEEGKEEEKLIAVLDFDMLCASVAQQTQRNWSKLQTHQDEGEYNDVGGSGAGAFRMWEGEILDCLHDRRLAAQSLCCPCYRFGENMRRAGFASCFLQGIVHYVLAISALANFVAFVLTKRHCFVYLRIGFTLTLGMYMGFFRTQMRKKFNIRGSDSFLDDSVHHLFCPCCTLCQESRTLEMNNVQDGIWHGRGDTLCVGSYSEGNKGFFELQPTLVVSTESPDTCSMQKSIGICDEA